MQGDKTSFDTQSSTGVTELCRSRSFEYASKCSASAARKGLPTDATAPLIDTFDMSIRDLGI
jgi:hypothetical protein